MMQALRVRIFRLLCHIALVCVALVTLADTGHAETWPTTEFVIEYDDLEAKYIPSALNPFDRFDDDQLAAIADYEAYLSKVALYYQSLGFRAPPLEITEGRRGGKAYRVYAYKFRENDAPAKALCVKAGETDLRLDISRAVVRGKTVTRAFEDLAHELFHNVQCSYKATDEAVHGNWIVEGQAQALGMEAAKRLRGIDAWTAHEDYRLGGRPYHWSLPTETSDETYRTASFWRYLAEYTTARRNNGTAGIEPIPADFSYLATVYEVPFTSHLSEKGDLKWLDAGLRNATGLGLDRLYAAFVSTFAAYVPDRLIKSPTSAQQAEDTWLKYIFGPCPTIALTSNAPSASHPISINGVASRCFKVDVVGTGPTSITIQTRASTVQKLWALRISTSGGEQIKSPRYLASPAGGGYIGQWRFDIQAGTPQVFIISNVADEAESSVLQSLSLNLIAAHWGSSLTVPQTNPVAPVKSIPNGSARARTQPATPSADSAMTSQTALGARAVFQRDRPSCGEPFAVAACGPSTTIRLSLVPNAIGDLAQAAGRGGITGQFIGQMSAGAKEGIAQELMASWRAIERTEGSSVHIVVPAIEYGFTGTFDNASITVGGGEGHGAYQALGPEDSSPGGDRVFLQSGHVTIEEFTPFIMRGRFEAKLTDMSQVEFAPNDVDQTLPVHRAISGSFVIASPWEGDPQVQVYQSGYDSAETSLQDIVEAFPILGTMDLSAVAPPTKAPPDRNRMPTSPVGAFPACDCSCQAMEDRMGPCSSICLVAVQQAEESATRRVALEAGQREQASLANMVDRMRSDFSAYLIKLGMADIKDSLLAVFDAQPTPEAKRFLLFTYHMPVDDYGD